jgi:hypothetical protein
MKNKTVLTESQKKIYDSVATNDWFTSHSLGYRFHNIDSQCHKIADKGYFEYKADFNPNYPGDLTMLISYFKKVKKNGEEK